MSTTVNSKIAAKYVSYPSRAGIKRKPRRRFTRTSNAISLLMLLMLAIPLISGYLWQQWEANAADARNEARLEASANRQEHLCLQISVYWEMKRKRAIDATAIAGNIMTRVDLPEYPDTVCEVVNEIRRNHKGGKTAMYSYIFDGRYIPQYNDTDWVSAGIVSENVMYAYENGLPYVRSVNYLTKEAYKVTSWAYNWKQNCEIKRIEVEGAYHIFFDKLTKAERKACLAAKRGKGNGIPVPTPRPAQDEVASLILASAN